MVKPLDVAFKDEMLVALGFTFIVLTYRLRWIMEAFFDGNCYLCRSDIFNGNVPGSVYLCNFCMIRDALAENFIWIDVLCGKRWHITCSQSGRQKNNINFFFIVISFLNFLADVMLNYNIGILQFQFFYRKRKS